MNIYAALVLAGFFVVIAILSRLAYKDEKRRWNDGKCTCCGEEWECFDTDSSGARGYKCPGGCGYGPWISYGFDAKPYVCPKHHA